MTLTVTQEKAKAVIQPLSDLLGSILPIYRAEVILSGRNDGPYGQRVRLIAQTIEDLLDLYDHLALEYGITELVSPDVQENVIEVRENVTGILTTIKSYKESK